MIEQTTGSEKHVAIPPELEVIKPKRPKPVVKARTKIDALRKLLSRSNGVTVAQLQNCLTWQPHTVRSAISRLRTSGVVIEIDQSGKVARYRAVSMEIGQ